MTVTRYVSYRYVYLQEICYLHQVVSRCDDVAHCPSGIDDSCEKVAKDLEDIGKVCIFAT